jgi:hypothetical protein
MRIPGLMITVLVLGLLGAGCATQIGERSVDTAASSTSANTTVVAGQAETAATTVTAVPTTISTTVAGLPGESYVGPGIQVGEAVAVIGVAHDDALNVRVGPGTGFGVSGAFGPTAVNVAVAGKARRLPESVWYEVNADSGTGWVNGTYLGLLGSTDDATSLVVDMLRSPLADDDLDFLGATIADAFLGEEGNSWIALVEPSEGISATAVGSLKYDAVGLDDDSVKGCRLVIMQPGTAQANRS